jgi:hypothetical protein
MLKFLQNTILIAAIFILCGGIYAQNRFEGYSLTVEANNDGACPVRWVPSSGGGNAIEVFIAGTNQRIPATNLTACDESQVRQGNNVFPDGLGRWCFNGPEPFYDIKLRTGITYLWYAKTKETGFFNVKDFRPVTRTTGANPQYVFSEPADYTQTIKNAVAFIAARQGGTLRFPDGDYIVGTLDGNRRDPKYEAITLPGGINIVGAGSNASDPGSDFPRRLNPTRIRLRNPNQTIFRIGGCTNQVTIRNLELIGNASLLGEAKRDTTGSYGIEAVGKWTRDPRTGGQSSNSSQLFKFENITIQNFDKGIYVHNANDDNCNSAEQVCGGWQFDYVKVDHAFFVNNKTGIWLDTFNTDWKVTNSVFYYMAANAPGDGIRVKKAASLLVEQSFGGGYDYGSSIGGTFINIDTIGTVTVIGSGSENGQRSLYTNPAGAISSMMVNVIGSVFGDKIDLSGRLNYVSSGNFYLAKTIDAKPEVTITSINDRFCHSPNVLPGRCVDDSGRPVQSPRANGGRIMFETGRVGEDAGANTLQGKPNFFGYNVRIGDGLMQFDPNITFKDITSWAAGESTRPKAEDGALVYCKDCKKATVCSQGTSGTDGAFAKRINGQWRCD